MKNVSKKQLEEFLNNSNWIEGEDSIVALEDSLLAWAYISKIKGELDVDDILILHRLLAQNINPRIAGKIRQCAVYVGGRAGALWENVGPLLEMWCDYYKNAKTEEEIKEAHIEYEKIHPFEDFNGRSGRILMNFQRVRVGLPLLIIHADWPKVGGEQYSYYQWFK